MRNNPTPILTKLTTGAIVLLAMLALTAGGQTLLDSFSDGDFTSGPVWGGDTANWTIVANSDAAAGAVGSQTLRLSGPATSSAQYLSTQIASWGDSQEWGFFIGRRAQAFTAVNQLYVWLYANQSGLATATGYRLAIGDDTGGDEIRLERISSGTLAATVIASAGTFNNGLTDIGFLVRVTRSSSGVWTIYTSTLPTANGTGNIATDVPNAANASVLQASATDNTVVPAASGYFGVGALHSTGAGAIISSEFDQIYFTPSAGEPANHVTSFAAGTATDTSIQLNWTDSAGSPAPDGYVIVAKTGAGTYATVVDGTAVADDSNWVDNNGAKNVAFGAQTCTFTGLNTGTSYSFLIYPYKGSGSASNFKTDGSVPTVTASTTGSACTPPATPTPATGGTVCAGDTLALHANTTADSYSWTGPNGFTSAAKDPTIAGATTNASGTYFLIVTTGGCPSAAGSVVGTVGAIPSPAITASNTVCSGTSGNTASVPDAGVGATYLWNITGGSGILPNNTSRSITYTANGSGVVTLTCFVTNAAGCGSSSSSGSITINPLPPTPVITAPGSVCEGSVGNSASVPDAGAGATYLWAVTGGSVSSGGTTNSMTFSSAGGALTVGCTITIGGCSSFSSVNVAANPSSPKAAHSMSGGDLSENFDDIAHWGNGFVCGTGSDPWYGVITNNSGTIGDGTKVTATSTNFSSGATGGVQRGTNTLVLLATGATDNTSAAAVDLHLDFTGRVNGLLSFQWAEVNNSTGDRAASLKIFTSTDGTTFTELPAADVLNISNNVAASGSVTTVALPAGFNGSPTAIIRFYYYNGTGGSTGSRPKIAIDGLVVASSSTGGCPTITLAPATLAAGTTGIAYTDGGTPVSAGGGTGPYTFIRSAGSLPGGISLNPDGSFSGSPTAHGTFGFTVTATDFNGCTGASNYSLTINCPTISLAGLGGSVTVGSAYSSSAAASGGTTPYGYNISSGALPGGLSLNTSSGAVSGISTNSGFFTFTVLATDANGCTGTSNYTITATCPTITLGAVPDAGVNTAYSYTNTASGGSPAYNFTVTGGGLPAGLTLDTNGTLHGNSPTLVTTNFTVTATDVHGCSGTSNYTMSVVSTCPTITLSGLPPAPKGAKYDHVVTAGGGVGLYAYTHAGTLPPGLTFTNLTHRIGGKPSAYGSYTFSVTATDANGCQGSQSYTILVSSAGADIKGPVVTITTPKNGAVVTNVPGIAVSGTAKDAVQTTNVTYRLDGGATNETVFTTSTAAPWSVALPPLSAGVHTITVQGTDLSGNLGAPVTVSFNYGTNSFLPLAGTYQGLFSVASNDVQFASAGFAQVTVSAKPGKLATFTAKLTVNGKTLSGAGSFGMEGVGTLKKPIDRSSQGLQPLTARLLLPFDGSGTLTGSIYNTNALAVNPWTSTLLADLTITNKLSTAGTAYDGIYTLVVPSPANTIGDGFGYLVITNGKVKLAGGKLANGQALSQSVNLGANGDWALFSKGDSSGGLYKSELLGWVKVSTGHAITTDNLVWLNTGGLVTYHGGFTNNVGLAASLYNANFGGGLVIPLTAGHGNVTLSHDGLTTNIANAVTLINSGAGKNKFLDGITNKPYKLTLTVSGAKGTIGGSFKAPEDGGIAKAAILGVVLQSSNTANGYFLPTGATQSGTFLLK